MGNGRTILYRGLQNILYCLLVILIRITTKNIFVSVVLWPV